MTKTFIFFMFFMFFINYCCCSSCLRICLIKTFNNVCYDKLDDVKRLNFYKKTRQKTRRNENKKLKTKIKTEIVKIAEEIIIETIPENTSEIKTIQTFTKTIQTKDDQIQDQTTSNTQPETQSIQKQPTTQSTTQSSTYLTQQPTTQSDPPTHPESFNYASFDCGALIISSNKESSSSTSILLKNKDQYMLNICSAQKFVVVELCNEILLNIVKLANYEFFSSMYFLLIKGLKILKFMENLEVQTENVVMIGFY